MTAPSPMTGPIRLLLVGTPGTELHVAAGMAREAGAEVAMAATVADALARLRERQAGLVMIDVHLDVADLVDRLRAERFAVPVLGCGIDAPASLAVAAIRAGARDYVPLPPQRELIAAAITSVIPAATDELIGDDPALHRALDYARTMARSRAAMLVCGEGGTGKAVIARIVHAASGRPGTFATAECAGIAADILDAELWGHEAGAFPGAVARRVGRLEEAAGGTLLLRDIDRMAPATQARLAATLAEGVVRRLGGDTAMPLTARLVATAAADPDAAVADGRLRADLLARLGLVRVSLPPLRDRAGDIAALVAHFVTRLAAADGLPPRAFADDTLALLATYRWPCNVRELEEVVHRALLLATGAQVTPADIVLHDGSRIDPAPAGQSAPPPLVGRTCEEVERDLILQTLAHCGGNRTSASGILGISVRTMRNKLKTFIEAGIPVAPHL